MRLSIDLTEDQIRDISCWLNSLAATGERLGVSCDGPPVDILTRLVCQAAVTHQVNTPEVAKVFRRDYDQFMHHSRGAIAGRRARLPKSHHAGPS